MFIFLCIFGKYCFPLDGRYRLFFWNILMKWSLILMTSKKYLVERYEAYPETSDCFVAISSGMITAVEEF